MTDNSAVRKLKCQSNIVPASPQITANDSGFGDRHSSGSNRPARCPLHHRVSLFFHGLVDRIRTSGNQHTADK